MTQVFKLMCLTIYTANINAKLIPPTVLLLLNHPVYIQLKFTCHRQFSIIHPIGKDFTFPMEDVVSSFQ